MSMYKEMIAENFPTLLKDMFQSKAKQIQVKNKKKSTFKIIKMIREEERS